MRVRKKKKRQDKGAAPKDNDSSPRYRFKCFRCGRRIWYLPPCNHCYDMLKNEEFRKDFEKFMDGRTVTDELEQEYICYKISGG